MFNRLTAFFVLFFLVSTPLFASHNLNDQLQDDMKWAMKKYHLSGMSLSYTLGEGSSIQNLVVGYANVENHSLITPNTYFEVGSITKAFISSLIMQQVEMGKISLDESLSEVAAHYPGNNNELLSIVKKYPHLGIITLRQYLTHISGIADSLNTDTFMDAFNKNPDGYWSSSDLIAIAMQHKPYFNPGEKDYYGYTNTDYIILGVVLEALTHKTLAEEVNALLHQLNLKNIYFPSGQPQEMPSNIKENMASAYIMKHDPMYSLGAFNHSPIVTFQDGTVVKNVTPVAINYTFIGAASGGAIARTSDLVKWYSALFHGQVIPSTLFPQMLKGVGTADKDKKYGLAIVIQKTKQYGMIYSHDGDVFGYDANLLYVPKLHLVLAVAVNTSTNAISSTEDDIVGRFLKTIMAYTAHR